MQDSTESRGGFRLSVLFYRDENEKNNTVNHTKDFLFRNNTHASCTLHSSLFYNAKNGYGALYGLLSG